MADTKTLTHEAIGTERSTISFPEGMWKRARKAAIDLGVPANQLVVEGLGLRLALVEADIEESETAR